ncbi:MAG: hydroxymethylglutaryl-CoA synthase, partial [Bacteroidia bacterium]
LFGKTPYYKNWVKETIAAGDRLSSEMGNLYTASIFLSLLSYCTSSQIAEGNTVIFFAYGSGSKAKVFEGTIAAGFAAKAALWRVDEVLAQRKQVTFDEYISLRSKKVETPLSEQNEIIQVASGVSPTNKFERTYTFKSK